MRNTLAQWPRTQRRPEGTMYHSAITLLMVTLAAPLPASPATGAWTVTERRLGELPSALVSTAVSPNGEHVIAIGREGRYRIVVDGVAHPWVGEAVPSDNPNSGSWPSIIYSPAGDRMAYASRAGLVERVVIDGVPSAEYEHVSLPVFSPDGKQVIFFASSLGRQRAVVGAQEGPAFDEVRAESLVFSADGTRYAYAARRGARWLMVVDGREDPASYEAVGDPSFSPDHQRYAYRAVTGGTPHYVVDGVRELGDLEFDPLSTLVWSARGHRYAYWGVRPLNGRGWQTSLVVDGGIVRGDAIIPDYQLSVDTARRTKQQQWYEVCFGADGSRFTYAFRSQVDARSGGFRRLANVTVVEREGGQEGPNYDRIEWLQMSPNGRHYAYVGQYAADPGIFRQRLAHLVVDSTTRATIPADGRVTSFAWGAGGDQWAATIQLPNGVRVVKNGTELGLFRAADVAWSGPRRDQLMLRFQQLNATNNSWAVQVNGVTSPEWPVARLFSQTPDGAHYAYDAGDRVVFDGQPGPPCRLQQTQLVGPGLQRVAIAGLPGPSDPYALMAFSSTGHLYYAADAGDGGRLYIDNAPGPACSWTASVFCSPDGEHYGFFGGDRAESCIVDGTSYPAPNRDWRPDIKTRKVVFSADSRHAAWVCAKQDAMWVSIDGQPGPSYSWVFENALLVHPGGGYRYLALKGKELYEVVVTAG